MAEAKKMSMREKGDFLLERGWKRQGWLWVNGDATVTMTEALRAEDAPKGPVVVLPDMPESAKQTVDAVKKRKPQHVPAGFGADMVAMLEARVNPIQSPNQAPKTYSQLTAEAERLYC